jgi:hypothetical protein
VAVGVRQASAMRCPSQQAGTVSGERVRRYHRQISVAGICILPDEEIAGETVSITTVIRSYLFSGIEPDRKQVK